MMNNTNMDLFENLGMQKKNNKKKLAFVFEIWRITPIGYLDFDWVPSSLRIRSMYTDFVLRYARG